MNLPSGDPPTTDSSSGAWIPHLTPDQLELAVRAADPAAFLVLPRILRRVIKQDRMLTGFGIRVPHRKSYVIDREPLLQVVDRSELGLADDALLPERILLIARPSVRKMAAASAGSMLIRSWRLLFHARVHAALDQRAAEGGLPPMVIRERIQKIGTAEFDEIRKVLVQEDMLLPPQSDESVYVEFIAVFLELRYFARSFLSRYFPGLKSVETVAALIRQDVNGESLFRATRPQGAPKPKDPYESVEAVEISVEDDAPSAEPLPPVSEPSETKYRSLMRKSQRPAELGNVVRAAIYHARAERYAPPEYASRIETVIKSDILRLIGRLHVALELDEASPQAWRESLFALVNQTPRGVWTHEARLLYDLQKVCVDHEREIYTVDLVEWALSWGRRPIKRPLPNQRDVLKLKHLRSAAKRLHVVRLSDRHREQLALLIHSAQQRVEARLREQIRPQIAAVLDKVKLTPHNLPEHVARKKMIEELLDRISDYGFLRMGDLRDAISRNNLKLPDLSEPLDFLRGDQLLRADRKLATTLDGVYHRGEFYLRWMQRISSLAFGTRTGRVLTRFAAVPFGGAYLILEGMHHVWELIAGHKPPPVESGEMVRAVAEEGLRWTSPSVVLTLGLFLLCLVNFGTFRHAVAVVFKNAYRIFHAIVVEPIYWLVQSRLWQQIFHSRVFTFLLRFVLKPFVWTAIVWWLLPDHINWGTSVGAAASIFVVTNLLLNSRPGRIIEEVVADWIVETWHRFGLRAIMGFFWAVVDLFKWIMETIERLMYAVDEWLRFRSGESRMSLVLKAGLGLLWFFVGYVLRFCVNVLIEPQINPIKHFPVVTVSHKLLLPLIPHFATVLELTLEKPLAWTVAGAIITSIPGVFGFLVWELKENWRLYAANRRPNLFPVRIGTHGETMARYLKPGLHSGTLPKRYAKLRRAERHARNGGSWSAARKHLHVLREIEASIRRYVERDFLELFAQSICWQAPAVTLERVRLGTNSVRLSFGCPELAEKKLEMALEMESGWLVAGITNAGWIDRLPPQQRRVLTTALLGLYKSAGADLVRQQIEDPFERPMPWYTLSSAGLVLWPDMPMDVEVLYNLHDEQWIAPQTIRGLSRRLLPTLERSRLVFSDVPASWESWVTVWNQDTAGQGHPSESFAPARVLP